MTTYVVISSNTPQRVGPLQSTKVNIATTAAIFYLQGSSSVTAYSTNCAILPTDSIHSINTGLVGSYISILQCGATAGNVSITEVGQVSNVAVTTN